MNMGPQGKNVEQGMDAKWIKPCFGSLKDPNSVPKDLYALICILYFVLLSSCRRVVVTSSRSAMVIGDPKGPGYTYTEADWNEIIDATTAGYPTSKTLSERAAWEAWENQKQVYQ